VLTHVSIGLTFRAFPRIEKTWETAPWNIIALRCVGERGKNQEIPMGFGRGALLWLIGIPLPVIILLALFWHH